MTKRAYLVLKQLKIIRYEIVGSIIFPILLSTYSLADMRVDQFFSFIMLKSSITIESVKLNQLISMKVKQQIIADVTVDQKAFDTATQEFRDYYDDKIVPRINNLEHHIPDSSIHIISPKVYIFWTEGLAPSAWSGNEFLYVISIKTGSPEILYSTRLDPKPLSSGDGYHHSVYWSLPDEGCGGNHFIKGILQYSVDNETDNKFVQTYLEYDQNNNTYDTIISTSPVMFSKPNCKD